MPNNRKDISLFSFTDRQIEVLQELGMGQTDKEIAEKLCLSFRTVNAHVHSICMKLNAKNRTEAVRKATERGLIRPNFDNDE